MTTSDKEKNVSKQQQPSRGEGLRQPNTQRPSGDERPQQTDILILDSIYRDPESIFSFQPQGIGQIKASAIIALDTNVLLIPYKTGKNSLKEIRRVYAEIIKKNRLVIPGRVAREFAKNRTEQLKNIYNHIYQKRINISESPYPLLEDSKGYDRLRTLEASLRPNISEYNKAIDALLDELKAWHWNDPVSTLYHELFKSGVVQDLSETDEESIVRDLEHRQAYGLPPGYKDQGKYDEGVGDLLIWKTVLQVGKARQQDVIFVSADRKADWWTKSSGGALYPRFELIEEYRRESGGKTLHIIDFAALLELFDAPKEVVAEVQEEEISHELPGPESPIAVVPSGSNRPPINRNSSRLLIYRWLKRQHPGSRVISHANSPFSFTVRHPERHSPRIGVITQRIAGESSWAKLFEKADEALSSPGDRGAIEAILFFDSVSELKEGEPLIKRFLRKYPVFRTVAGVSWGNGTEFMPFTDYSYS